MHRFTIYIGSDDHSLYALAAATGAQRWRARLGAVIAGPALADGVVYAGLAGGQVAAVWESTGAVLWHGTTAGVLPSSPVVADGMVFAGAYGPSYLAGTLSVWAPPRPPGASSANRPCGPEEGHDHGVDFRAGHAQ